MPARGRRREIKHQVRDVAREQFADLDEEDYAQHAGRVLALCPCEHEWTVPLWDIIFAACSDPSPVVRIQGLHVIEDSYTSGMARPRGMRLIYAALRDPDEEVRRYAADLIKNWPKLRAQARRRSAPRHDADLESGELG